MSLRMSTVYGLDWLDEDYIRILYLDLKLKINENYWVLGILVFLSLIMYG